MRKPRMDMGLLLAKQKEQLTELAALEDEKTEALLERQSERLMDICKKQEELSVNLENASFAAQDWPEDDKAKFPLFGEIKEIVTSLKSVVDRNDALIRQNAAMISAVLGQLSGRESVEVYTETARPVRSAGESVLLNVTS